MDDKAGQVQSELSGIGVENTPKCTRPNCILARQSSLGPPPVGGVGPSVVMIEMAVKMVLVIFRLV